MVVCVCVCVHKTEETSFNAFAIFHFYVESLTTVSYNHATRKLSSEISDVKCTLGN